MRLGAICTPFELSLPLDYPKKGENSTFFVVERNRIKRTSLSSKFLSNFARRKSNERL